MKNTSGLAAKFVCEYRLLLLPPGYYNIALIEIFHMVPFPYIVRHWCSEPTLR